MVKISIYRPFGYTFFVAIYNLLPEWFNFMILFMIIPLVGILILMYTFLLETPIYSQLNKKDRIEFEKTMRILAIFNKSEPEVFERCIKAGNLILTENENLLSTN